VSVYSSKLGPWRTCQLRVLLDDGDNTDISDEWLASDERLLWDIMRRQNPVKHQRERLRTKPDDPATTLEMEKVPQVTVQVLLNLVTKSISPQFHDVVFDDISTSVHSDPDMEPDTWRQLITSFSCRLQVVLDDDDNLVLVDDWLTPDERLLRDDPALTLEREKVPQVTAQVRFQAETVNPSIHDVK
jgi:hypothetical protein